MRRHIIEAMASSRIHRGEILLHRGPLAASQLKRQQQFSAPKDIMNIMNIMFSITDATTNLRAYTFIHDGKKRFQSREVGRKRELSEQLKVNLSPRSK